MYSYTRIRILISLGNIQTEEYYVTIFGNEKYVGDGEYNFILSFLLRLCKQLIILAVILSIYYYAKTQLEDMIGEEKFYLLSIFFCVSLIIWH